MWLSSTMHVERLLILLLFLSLCQARWDKSCAGGCVEHGGGDLAECCDMMCNLELKDSPIPNCEHYCNKGLTCDGKNPADYQGCADKGESCQKWAEEFCSSDSATSGDFCPVTCGQCDPSKTYEGCVDMLKMCPNIPNISDMCDVDWIKKSCKKSCNNC